MHKLHTYITYERYLQNIRIIIMRLIYYKKKYVNYSYI